MPLDSKAYPQDGLFGMVEVLGDIVGPCLGAADGKILESNVAKTL